MENVVTKLVNLVGLLDQYFAMLTRNSYIRWTLCYVHSIFFVGLQYLSMLSLYFYLKAIS